MHKNWAARRGACTLTYLLLTLACTGFRFAWRSTATHIQKSRVLDWPKIPTDQPPRIPSLDWLYPTAVFYSLKKKETTVPRKASWLTRGIMEEAIRGRCFRHRLAHVIVFTHCRWFSSSFDCTQISHHRIDFSATQSNMIQSFIMTLIRFQFLII